MTLKEAKDILNKKKDSVIETWENENVFDCFWVEEDVKAIDTVLKALEDSIPKEKVRKLINSYERDMKLCDDTDMFEAVESNMYAYGIDRLKELLWE